MPLLITLSPSLCPQRPPLWYAEKPGAEVSIQK